MSSPEKESETFYGRTAVDNCKTFRDFKPLTEVETAVVNEVREIMDGNHEDLYDALRADKVDIILNDQRRAFSDAYVNQILATSEYYVEIFEHSPLAQQESLTIDELKTVPCILAASPHQRNNEETCYREIRWTGW